LKRSKFIDILKWVWIVVVLFGAGWYFYQHYLDISQYLDTVVIPRLLLSFGLLFIAKLLLSDVARLSLRKINYSMPYTEAMTINSITQLGKYLPGGIWHFAGKFGIYKVKGISTKKTTQTMVVENLWLVSSAGTVGAVAMLASNQILACQYLRFLCIPGIANIVAFVIPILLLTGLVIFEYFFFGKQKIKIMEFVLTQGELVAIWLIYGISFWLVFPPGTGYIPQLIGAFSLSWLIGYVTLFAPGGLGVREVLLAVLLSSFFKSDEIAIYAAIHRVLWVLAEVLLGGLSALIFGLPVNAGEQSHIKE
jgi:glycosyltransferase 2 family protein